MGGGGKQEGKWESMPCGRTEVWQTLGTWSRRLPEMVLSVLFVLQGQSLILIPSLKNFKQEVKNVVSRQEHRRDLGCMSLTLLKRLGLTALVLVQNVLSFGPCSDKD